MGISWNLDVSSRFRRPIVVGARAQVGGHADLADRHDRPQLDLAQPGQPRGPRLRVGDRLLVGLFLELVEVLEDEPDQPRVLLVPSIVVRVVVLLLRADVSSGVLGDVEQPGDELQHGVLVHLADVGAADDELARELDLGLVPLVGLVAAEEVQVVHHALLIDEQPALLDRDVAQLERGEGVAGAALGVAILDDRVGGQLGCRGDLQVDLDHVRPGRDDGLAGDGEALDVHRAGPSCPE